MTASCFARRSVKGQWSESENKRPEFGLKEASVIATVTEMHNY